MTAVDRVTGPQPAVRPVPRFGRAVATYVLEMSDRVQYRNATSQEEVKGYGTGCVITTVLSSKH